MGKERKGNKAKLPQNYQVYVFDLYGTLVDIHTDENDMQVWEKLSLFYGYYEAYYEPAELKKAYGRLVAGKEQQLKATLENDPKYSHEASPEIEITEVFAELFAQKGVEADSALVMHAGQFFRVLTTEYVRVYKGTKEMLAALKEAGKKVYLLSNAQRIFTAYEMQVLDIMQYFDGVLISSDYGTKKPDKRFFDILIDKYGINPGEALFVGNDMRSDIMGAQSVDFDTFYVNSNISPQKDIERKKDLVKKVNFLIENFTEWDCEIFVKVVQ